MSQGKSATLRSEKRVVQGPVSLGHQWIVECMDLPSSKLDDPIFLEPLFVGAACAAGATVLGSSFHHFEPQGVSGVVLLAESHLTVHSWPEHRYAAIDLFSCSDHICIEPVIKELQRGLGPGDFQVTAVLPRGIVERETVSSVSQIQLSWRARYEVLTPSAMSILVDIEGCSPDLTGESLREILQAEVSHQGWKSRDWPILLGSPRDRTVFFPLEEGHLSTRWLPSKATLHMDLFYQNFVDPIALGLAIRQRVGGRHHAISCIFRR